MVAGGRRRVRSGGSTPPQQHPLYKYQITGSPAFAQIEVTLEAGQSIVADGGALLYMRSPVQRGTLQVNGVLKGVGRALAGESFFQNVYEVPSNETPGEVAFASVLPGDAVYLALEPGVPWKLSRGAYIASSPNVKVSGKLNWRGFLSWGQEEGFVLPTVEAEGGPGCAFVGTYGGIKAHELKEGETLLVDNGLFLMCDARVQYELVTMGRSLLSSWLGGEGLGMKFTGPCRVYTQTRNVNDFLAYVAQHAGGGGSGSGNVATGVVAGAAAGATAGIFDALFSGGGSVGGRTPRKKKQQGRNLVS